MVMGIVGWSECNSGTMQVVLKNPTYKVVIAVEPK